MLFTSLVYFFFHLALSFYTLRIGAFNLLSPSLLIRTRGIGSGMKTVDFEKEPETSHKSKMADREELEFTTSKRARWSSESSCDQMFSYIDSNDKDEAKDDSILRLIGSEHSVSVENVPSETTSREQHGGHVSHERLESDDFPTCFSVEDDLDNLDEYHYQPIAGSKSFCVLNGLKNKYLVIFSIRHFVSLV